MKVVDESIKGYDDIHVEIDPAEAGNIQSIKNSEKKLKDAMKEIKGSEVTDDGAIIMKPEKEKEPKKVKSQDLKKMHLEENLFESYYYGDNSIEDNDAEDSSYVVIEGTRDGYAISQVEGYTMTVGELIDCLNRYEDETRVVIGNDSQSYGFYTYGSISDRTIHEFDIIKEQDDEEDDEDDEEEDDEDDEEDEIREQLMSTSQKLSLAKDINKKATNNNANNNVNQKNSNNNSDVRVSPDQQAEINNAVKTTFSNAEKANFTNKEDIIKLKNLIGVEK